MSGEALTEWSETDAERREAFTLRFLAALNPLEDLGVTEELHEAEIARRVEAIHSELSALGQEEYSATWRSLSWASREAIKKYVELARKQS